MKEKSSLDIYIDEHSTSEDKLLYDLNRETHLRLINPRMLSGKLQGQILESFSRMIKPKNILELGTYTGYSALCLVKGLRPEGKLITIDVDDEVLFIAKKYFKRANVIDKIEIKVGDASKVIDKLDIKFDLVFMDADKSKYIENYEKLLPLLNIGGYIIADNVLWDGKVVQKEIKKNDNLTSGIIAFNQHVQNDSRVTNYILPIRDGMMIIRKL